MDGFADFHTHTVYSHGRGSPLDNALAARRRGLRQVGISDHGPANLFGVGIDGIDALRRLRREIDGLRTAKDLGVQIFLGIEANVVDLEGTLDVPEEVLAELDYVMVGLHVPVRPRRFGDALRFAAVNGPARWLPAVGRRARFLNTEALIGAVNRYPVDVITHPGWRLPIDTPALAAACAARGTALEVNASHHHGGVAYIRAAAAEGVDFVAGSDAHNPERVGDFRRAFALLAAAGMGWERVRNALSPEGKLSAAAEQAIRAGLPVVRVRPARPAPGPEVRGAARGEERP